MIDMGYYLRSIVSKFLDMSLTISWFYNSLFDESEPAGQGIF